MLIETINSAISKIDHYYEAKNHQVEIRKLETYIKGISDTNVRLSTLIEVSETIIESKISQSPIINETNKCSLLEAIDGCGSKLPNFSLSSGDVTHYQDTVDKFYSFIENNWRINATEYGKGLVQYLGIIQNLLPDPEKVRTLKVTIETKMQKVPQNKADVMALVVAVASAKSIIDKLEVDEHIRTFLINVFNGSATISDLDNEIIQWARSHHLEKKIKVSF